MDDQKLEAVEYYDVIRIQQYGDTCGLEGQLLENLKKETRFIPIQEAPGATNAEEAEAIGLGKITCPMCSTGSDEEYGNRKVLLIHEGKDTGQRILRQAPCRCLLYRNLYTRWSGPKSMAPWAYRKFRLMKLTASLASRLTTELQENVIFELQENPERSYLFVGPAGTSKTVFTTALFGHALFDWADRAWRMGITTEAVWRVVASDYLQQEHDYVMQKSRQVTDSESQERVGAAEEPIISRRKIRAARIAGFVPRIFIEEIDKTPRLTEFRGAALFGIINEVYEQGGQIVVNSNKTVSELIEHFGPNDGEAIMRRFTSDDNPSMGITFDFYASMAQQRNP